MCAVADVDHILLRVRRFDEVSPIRADGTTTTTQDPRPPGLGARRSISFRGRRPTLLMKAEDGTDVQAKLPLSEKIEEQLRAQARAAAKKQQLSTKGKVLDKEQFVEVLVRIAAHPPSALGTGIAEP